MLSARCAAFVKRLAILSLHLKHVPALLSLLDLLKRLLLKSPDQVWDLLRYDDDRMTTSGAYRFDLDNPELCNPFNTALWELTALGKHWDVNVRLWVKDIEHLEKDKSK